MSFIARYPFGSSAKAPMPMGLSRKTFLSKQIQRADTQIFFIGKIRKADSMSVFAIKLPLPYIL